MCNRMSVCCAKYINAMHEKPFFCALGLNILFLLLYIVFGRMQYGALDDYFISSVLTGAYGAEYDVHLYFVNAILGYILRPLYWLFPKTSWYFVFELLGTFFSFTTISYFVIRRLTIKYGVLISSILLAAFSPDFYFQLQFTQCATIYTAAGIVAFAEGLFDEKKQFLILGVFLFLAGSIMRFEGILLGMPFAAILLTKSLLERKISLTAFLTLCLLFASVWGLRAYDRSLYAEGEYKYYADYQPIRAYFGDGAFYDEESTYDELEERGLSGADFNMLTDWIFYDTEVFQIDSLKPILKIVQNNLYKPNQKRMPLSILTTISNAFTRSGGWCWAFFCALLIYSSSRRTNIYPWISFGLITICVGYLLFMNRLVYHVESGIWLYAVAVTIPLMPKLTSKSLKNEKSILWGGAMLSILFTFVGISSQTTLNKDLWTSDKSEIRRQWSDFIKYSQKHPENVFLLPFTQYKTLALFKEPAYKAIKPGSWNNIISLGYWNIHLPKMREELEKRGVNNPIRDIVNDNVYVLSDENSLMLPTFYLFHYHDSLHIDTIQTFGDLKLLKCRLERVTDE